MQSGRVVELVVDTTGPPNNRTAHLCCTPVSYVALRTQITVVGVVVRSRLRVPSAFGHLSGVRGENR